MKSMIVSVALVLLGMVVFILWDLAYNPKGPRIKSLREFNIRRYWNTNQMRLVTLFIGGIVIAAFIVIIKQWVDALVAQLLAVLGGIAGTLANKKLIDKNEMVTGKPTLLTIAKLEEGITETKGEKHTARILQYAKEAGFHWVKDDETPWCAIFMNWVIWRTGRMGTGSAAARSFETWGIPASEADIASGNVVGVFKRGKSSTAGHVGIITNVEGNYYRVFGGNQTDSVKEIKMSKLALLTMRKPE